MSRRLRSLRLCRTVRAILSPTTLSAWRSFLLWPLGPWLNHCQRNAATIFIDRGNPRANLVAYRDYVVRIADVARAELADVYEAAV